MTAMKKLQIPSLKSQQARQESKRLGPNPAPPRPPNVALKPSLGLSKARSYAIVAALDREARLKLASTPVVDLDDAHSFIAEHCLPQEAPAWARKSPTGGNLYERPEGLKPGELWIFGGPSRSVPRTLGVSMVGAYIQQDNAATRTISGKLQGVPHVHRPVSLPPKDAGPADRQAARESFGLRGRKHQEKRQDCDRCHGTGQAPGAGLADCRPCKGSGEARR